LVVAMHFVLNEEVLFQLLLPKASRPDLESVQPYIHRLRAAISPWVKRSGREVKHSSPPRADGVRMSGTITPLSNIPSWCA